VNTPFHPTAWRDEEVAARAREVGIDLPPECLPGVKANLALLEERWALLAAAVPDDAA